MALLGPRQCGKTTLARQFVGRDSINYFDLEEPASLARLTEPQWALERLEGLVVIDEIQRRPEQEYFWATHNRAELDLLIFKDGRKIGIECKRQDAPKLTPSMKIAMADLKLDELRVIYPGSKAYPLADAIQVLPLESLA